MKKFDIIQPGYILKEHLNEIRKAQITLAQCIYQFPSGGKMVDGKDYVDLWHLERRDVVKDALETIAAVYNLNIEFKEV
jgi:hypothetical protein